MLNAIPALSKRGASRPESSRGGRRRGREGQEKGDRIPESMPNKLGCEWRSDHSVHKSLYCCFRLLGVEETKQVYSLKTGRTQEN